MGIDAFSASARAEAGASLSRVRSRATSTICSASGVCSIRSAGVSGEPLGEEQRDKRVPQLFVPGRPGGVHGAFVADVVAGVMVRIQSGEMGRAVALSDATASLPR